MNWLLVGRKEKWCQPLLLVSATIFVAFASYVSNFATAVARLRLVWTVSGNVTALVAIVARDVAVAIVGLIGAIASYMTGFITVVTAWFISWLMAITWNVTGSIATIASLVLLVTHTSIMSVLVAFVAFLAVAPSTPAPTIRTSSTSMITTIAAAAAATWNIKISSSTAAFSGEMSRTITFVARVLWHFL